MRPLLYLYSRTFVNAVRRAFSSPQRLIGLLVFIAYNMWWLPRLLAGRDTQRGFEELRARIPFPPMEIVDAVVFLGFSAMTLILALGVFGYKGGFKPADVDVLFPTPVSPRTVMVGRLVRDYLVTLILPLFFVLVFWSPAYAAWTTLFRNLPNPETAGRVLQFVVIAYLATTLVWVSVQYAVGIFLTRTDPVGQRWSGPIAKGLGTLFAMYVAWIGYRFYTAGAAGWVDVAQSTDFRIVFAPASLATSFGLSPLTGDWLMGAAAGLGLVALGGIGLWMALAQWSHLYEQAAVGAAIYQKESKRRQGDQVAVATDMAERGKLRAKGKWFMRVRAYGVWAMIAKEVLLTRRVSLAISLIMLAMALALTFAIARLPEGRRGLDGSLIWLMGMGLLTFMTLSSQQPAFLDSLKRIDLLKPLPFHAWQICLSEAVGKALSSLVLVASATVLFIAMEPRHMLETLAGCLMLSALVVASSAGFLLLTVLLPDFDDPTQRSFRGLVTLLGFAVVIAPPVGLYALFRYALNLHSLVASLPAAIASIAMAGLALWLATAVYEGFNPAE